MERPTAARDSVQESLAELDRLLGLQAETLHEAALAWLLQQLQSRVLGKIGTRWNRKRSLRLDRITIAREALAEPLSMRGKI